jgi:hypothetical protein
MEKESAKIMTVGNPRDPNQLASTTTMVSLPTWLARSAKNFAETDPKTRSANFIGEA